MILTPEQLAESHRKQVENLLAKQAKGKPLTANELRTITAAASAHEPATTANYAKTWEELANQLGVTRRGLKKICDRYPTEFPSPKADGRHDVAKWLEFFVAKNLNGAAEDIPLDEVEDVESGPMSVAEWKAEEIKLKCMKLELENCRVSGKLVEAASVEKGISVLVQSFRQALNNLPDRLAGKIVGITDYHEAVEIAQEEVNVILRTLQRCDFLEEFSTIKEEQALPEAALIDEPEGIEAPVKRKPGRPRKAA